VGRPRVARGLDLALRGQPRPESAATFRASAAGRGNGRPEPDSELRARLAALPERQRLVVFLRYFADLEYSEIAAALGIHVGTVSATLYAAHANLRASVEEVTA
jgi:DNA-directed RNA polymerase specialized sigma24 family protein